MEAGSSADSGGGGSTTGGILRVGTINTIDSLNPFTAIESQSYNAFVMEYPQLVQYGPGPKLEGDWATSWSHSADGKTWTFKLKPGGKWSDGKPLTAADAAWTGNTIVKYQASATAALAARAHARHQHGRAERDHAVIHYDAAVANVLPQLEQFWVLPEHVWGKLHRQQRQGSQVVPAAGPPADGGRGRVHHHQVRRQGHHRVQAQPGLLRAQVQRRGGGDDLLHQRHDDDRRLQLGQPRLRRPGAVQRGQLASRATAASPYTAMPSSEVTNITFNTNPVKPKNRELLNLKVREALEYATDRKQIVDIVFAGLSPQPWANIISSQSTVWLDPSIQPLPFDIDKANQILDSLGYKKNSDGIREVPATTGKYAQPAHEMSYDLMVPGRLDFNGDRQFQIIANDWLKAGVKLHEVAGGDSGRGVRVRDRRQLHQVRPGDVGLGRVHRSRRSDVVHDQGAVAELERHRLRQPAVRQVVQAAGDPAELQGAPGADLQDGAADRHDRPYIQLVDEDLVTASTKGWTGF